MSVCGITPALGLAANTLDGIEGLRIATNNRYLKAISDDEDNDGLGLDESDPDVALMAEMLSTFEQLERQAVLRLERAMRAHPLGQWVKDQKGIGLKQAARLLAVIDDPYWHFVEDRPRTVSELWAYTGYHVTPEGTAPRRAKGSHANWSHDARMRMRMIAEACLKAQGEWADVYYWRREQTEGRTHTASCAQCGTPGKPAKKGTPLRPGHLHSDALRVMSKEILRHLWCEARYIHEQAEAKAA